MLHEILRKLKPKRPAPEESIPFRVFTLLTVMTGILAVLYQEDWPANTIPIIVGTVVGFYVSYVRRYKKNTLLKVILSLLMMYSLFNFLGNLRREPYTPQVPLANLLLWLQALHSYDLPSRRDLNYSLIVGLILLGVASVLTVNSNIVIFYLFFILFGCISLVYNNQSRFNTLAENSSRLKLPFILKRVAVVSLLIIVTSGVVFLFIPRYEGLSFRPLPRSWVIRLPSFTRGRLVNPGQEESAEALKDKPGLDLNWDPDVYFGFNTYVHLNYRGRLSDKEVMKVQSSRWSYIRGLAFDRYDGTGWEITGEDEEEFEKITRPFPPIRIEPDPDLLKQWSSSEEIVQIYHIRSEMPNIIFGAYDIHLLFFPSQTIYRDINGGLRSPFPLQKGMIYSSVSRFLPLTPKRIKQIEEIHQRKLNSKDDDKIAYEKYPFNYQLYTQIPDDFPDRVGEFTRKIINNTVGEDASDLRKVQAISNFLRETYPYDLDIPPFPQEADVVDYFLFEQKRGYCEHFASALTMMLRTRGIPARMIFGYLPGEYNVLSGYYTVRQSDAHAWVEAYIPGFGWYAIDPTPGFSSETFSPTRNRSKWLFLSIIKKLEQYNIPVWQGTLVLILALVLIGVEVGLVYYYKEIDKTGRKKKPFFAWLTEKAEEAIKKIQATYTRYGSSQPAHPVTLLYRQMIKEFEKNGIKKSPQDTAREFVNNKVPPVLASEAHKIVAAFELARYSATPPADEEVNAVEDKLEKLRSNLKDYSNKNNKTIQNET